MSLLILNFLLPLLFHFIQIQGKMIKLGNFSKQPFFSYTSHTIQVFIHFSIPWRSNKGWTIQPCTRDSLVLTSATFSGYIWLIHVTFLGKVNLCSDTNKSFKGTSRRKCNEKCFLFSCLVVKIDLSLSLALSTILSCIAHIWMQ